MIFDDDNYSYDGDIGGHVEICCGCGVNPISEEHKDYELCDECWDTYYGDTDETFRQW